MKTKNEIYLSVNSQKKADKLKKVLKMFNQPTYSNKSISHCIGKDLVLHYDGEEWLNASADWLILGESKKEKVSIKELKNILALEFLKKGDVIILEGGEEKYRWVIEVDHVSQVSSGLLEIYPRWFIGLDGVEKFDEETNHIEGQFIRYATKAEKALLLGEKVEESEPLVKIGNWYWFQRPEFEKRALVYVNDISLGNEGNFGFNYGHEWMSGKGDETFGVSCALEGGIFYGETTITKATGEEVEQMLVEEAGRRGFKIGVKFLGCKGYDKDKVIDIDKFNLGFGGEDGIKGLYCGNSWITFKGDWGTVVEEDEPKVGDIVEVAICGEPYSFITVIQKLHKSPYEYEKNPYTINGWCVTGQPKILKTEKEIIGTLKLAQ